MSRTLFFAIIGIAMCVAAGCNGSETTQTYNVPTGGNANRGKALMVAFSCGACHVIPGVPNANGLVGPPLNSYARRTFVAGEVPNNADNLVQWIKSPKSIEPGTAMPELGLSDQQARDMAAYLYTLR
jgi:cytochrome c